jgi:hypothetical protein
MLNHLTVVTHPLVQHKLSIMRDKETSTASFRKLLREVLSLTRCGKLHQQGQQLLVWLTCHLLHVLGVAILPRRRNDVLVRVGRGLALRHDHLLKFVRKCPQVILCDVLGRFRVLNFAACLFLTVVKEFFVFGHSSSLADSTAS